MGGHDETIAGLSDRDSLGLAKILELVDKSRVLPRAHISIR